MSGNVFSFSFSREGFESIINLTEVDQEELMAKIEDRKPEQSVGSILTGLKLRAQYNQQRGMEVWLVKLDDHYTEENLWAWAESDPQAVADLARMGEALYSEYFRKKEAVIK